MALNFLFERHQISLMREAAAASPEARVAHRGLVAGYARRIGELRFKLEAELRLRTTGAAVRSDLGMTEPSENPDRGFAD